MIDWILPLHHQFVLFLGVFIAILGLGLLRSSFNLSPMSRRKTKLALASAMIVLAILDLGWAIYAGYQRPAIAKVVDYEVKLVKFPDGKEVQMFHVDGENKNANQMFACQVPAKHVVRRTIYERVYCGIYYPKNDDSKIKDQYRIVDPLEKEE